MGILVWAVKRDVDLIQGDGDESEIEDAKDLIRSVVPQVNGPSLPITLMLSRCKPLLTLMRAGIHG